MAIGFAPPLKYGPTGVQKMRNSNSVAGFTPMTLFVPIMNGRMYRLAPVPYGGTKSAFAATTCFTASTNLSTGKGGISSRAALSAMRLAFMSGRKQTICPSLV